MKKLKIKNYGTCCCCGKSLTKEDVDYYDLTNYCSRCALADGIITSLD